MCHRRFVVVSLCSILTPTGLQVTSANLMFPYGNWLLVIEKEFLEVLSNQIRIYSNKVALIALTEKNLSSIFGLP